MAVNTLLLDFSVDPKAVKNDSQLSIITKNVENILKDYLAGLKRINSLSLDGGLFNLYTSEAAATTCLRIYSNGLITLNIDYYRGEKQEPLLSFERCKELERHLGETVVDVKRSQVLAPLKRGTFIKYYPTSDERLLEYDIDQLVFEEKSPFQKVQIVHSKTLGNMLVLDDLQNISEADLIYTETLMARGKENYKDKEIVILGGGDGALLYELLKEEPKEVIMLEIDETVMKACSIHMRSICGPVLDSMKGPNYQIVIGDCMKAVECYIKEGRKFDYVFGDLTDVPISDTPSGETWGFINKILQMSFKILRPEGKFMTHLIGSALKDSIDMYLSELKKIQPPVTYTLSSAFVPSFLEDWVFCQVMVDKDKEGQ